MNNGFKVGSTAIMVYTGHSVLMAADSKQRMFRNGELQEELLVHKIHSVGNIGFSLIGIPSIEQPPINLYEILNRALQGNEDLQGLINTTVEALLVPIQTIAATISQVNPQYFIENIVGRPIEQVLIGVYNLDYKGVLIKFIVAEKNGQFGIILETLPLNFEGFGMLTIGENNAITVELDRFGDDIQARFRQIGSYTECIEHLMHLQTIATSDFVGPPIDILEIDNNGLRWLQRRE